MEQVAQAAEAARVAVGPAAPRGVAARAARVEHGALQAAARERQVLAELLGEHDGVEELQRACREGGGIPP